MEPIVSFGYWLRRQRKALDLTQQALADQVGCSLAAIKKIEQDERRPSRQIAELLANALDVPASQREVFVEVARGLRPVDGLSSAHGPASRWYPSGTVTFLYTDIEGSTKLAQQYRSTWEAFRKRHHNILRAAMEAHHGYIFQIIGDAFCAAFHTASDALNAAVKSQVDLQAENWGEIPIRVRMGIHTGSAEIQEDLFYHGYITLSHVQRLMSAGHGGQVLLSTSAQELVQDELPQDVELRDMGEHRLKDFDRAEHLFQLNIAGLPSDFPPLTTLDSSRHNLPVPLTSFIGREKEIADVIDLLQKARLLTLTGPGGTGKTRLSLQIGEKLLPTFAEGVWIAELAPLTDPSIIPQTLAATFGLRELPNMPLSNIVTDYLRAKQLLLILDNCEHLIDICAKLSDHLLHACPQLKIIATSREALGIAGEISYRVPSLSLPDHAQVTREAVLEFESVQLFMDRTSAANPKFHLSNENASDVAQICRRLDGIPLALELAAACMRVFSAEEIAAHLDDRFRLLTGGSRTALGRHQTLRALIDWSYELLSNAERTLFRHISVFSGGWTFEAAEAVCPDLDVLNLLTQLVNKSLVMVDSDAQGDSTRYRLLDTIRQYSSEKLLEVGESEQARVRHLNFFLNFAEEAEAHFNSPQELEWTSRLETEYDNLRSALEWAMKSNIITALRLGTALYLFWNRQCYHEEGRRLLNEALARLQKLPPVEGAASDQRIALRIRALNAFGRLGFGVGEFVGSLQIFEESVYLARQIGEKSALAESLSVLGYVKATLGDADGSYQAAQEGLTLAREVGDKVLLGSALSTMADATAATHGDPKAMWAYMEESLQLYREAGARWAFAMAFFRTGLLATSQGNYAEARSRFEACLPLLAKLGDRNHLNGVQSGLAHLERKQGHFAQAIPIYRKTLLEWQRLGNRAAIAHQLECLAMIAKAQEEDLRATRLFGAAQILRETIGIPMTSSERVEYEREVNDLRRNMDEATFTKAWADGRALTMEQAITFALESEDSQLPTK